MMKDGKFKKTFLKQFALFEIAVLDKLFSYLEKMTTSVTACSESWNKTQGTTTNITKGTFIKRIKFDTF